MTRDIKEDPESYEVHVTVDLDGAPAQALATFANERGLRWIHLVLDSGEYAEQLMLTWRQKSSLNQAIADASAIGQALAGLCIKIIRIKIESNFTDSLQDGGEYYEAHFKVELKNEQHAALQRFAHKMGSHLSRTAFTRLPTIEHRYLTVRHRHSAAAKELFDRIEAALARENWHLVAMHREVVWIDTNLQLDNGWSS